MNIYDLPNALSHEGGLTRRLFLAYAASLSSIPLLSHYGSANPAHDFTNDPFTLGVASGDPDHESVILWTRLAPKPLEPGGGMPKTPVEVHWEIAEDNSFKKIVQSGKVNATPELGHSLHIEPRNLKPDHWYSYRFKSGDAISPVGRTRTLPAPTKGPKSNPWTNTESATPNTKATRISRLCTPPVHGS